MGLYRSHVVKLDKLQYYIDTDADYVVSSQFKCNDMHTCVLYFTDDILFVMFIILPV